MTTVVSDRRDSPQQPRIKVDARAYQALPWAIESLAPKGERDPVIWAVAAHGGAGASTLAKVLAPVGDAGQQWPVLDEFPFCVVVCRSTRSGLDAAHLVVLQAHSGHAGSCQVLGVVVIADAPGKTPKSLVRREKLIEDLTTVWRVPYIPGFRECENEELAVWIPSRERGEEKSKRRSKKIDVTEEVPVVLRDLGDIMFKQAFELQQGVYDLPSRKMEEEGK